MRMRKMSVETVEGNSMRLLRKVKMLCRLGELG